MNNNKVEQFKNLLFQKDQLLLESRAELAEADRRTNNENDIQGLMNFLWEPLRQEGFEFTCDQNEQGYQLKVTRCPVGNEYCDHFSSYRKQKA